MGLGKLAARNLREEGLSGTVGKVVSEPGEVVYASEAFRIAVRLYSRARPIRSRGIVVDASDELVRGEVHKLAMNRYEHEIADFVERYVPPTLDVVELGGGIGFVACVVDRRIAGDQLVVEPNPAILPTLKRTRELNDASFEIVERAYEPDGTDVELAIGEQFIKASTARHRRDGAARVRSAGTVVGVSLGELRDAYDLEEFVLIVDVEGAEVDLVDAELDLVRESCPYLVVEYHHFDDVERDVREARETLEETELVALDSRANDKTEKVIYRNPRLAGERRPGSR
ncbi:FkbM family methyltransferase [Halovivax sp.]|uniref:FkbM family methyltransferase n=1 Tax=Halovivax sp. TaxID=1935978 RepID=UPI0025C666A1|nr:FkbM family methyltransferase [Halovivax sp.]